MTSLTQFLLVIVITTLTVLVTVVAIQVWQILFEVRAAMKKINKVLDNTQTLSDISAKPIASVNQFFSEVKQLVDQTQEEIIEATPDRVVSITESESTEPKKHFFHRSGLPLRAS
ncbi:MAG: hypothetical protein Q7S31_03890 [bacterium]|nr:hypothetical protein [bacterium]